MSNFIPMIVAVVLSATAAMAETLAPVTLSPIQHHDAQIVVVSPDGEEITYRPAELERMTTYRMTTRTPWREVAAEFDGVMLNELLEETGLGSAPSILVTAENDYRTVISREVLDSIPILVATRVDGRAHTRRERGPIQFVLDMESYEASPLTSEGNYVWMVARIEAGE